MSKRIAVLVSGGGTNLQALIDAQTRGEIVNGEIVLVISSTPSAYALERAAKAGIPSCVVARKEYPSNQAMTVALVDKLKEARIDLVVLAGFMVILTGEMVQAYPNAILNVHPALIPSFAGPGCYGLHVHEKALEYPSNQAMTVALVDKLKEARIDLVVLAGFMVILTQEMVQAYPNAILNVHPALIPSFAGPGCYGLHVHEKALEYGVKLTGATVHFVSEECDGGPIVSQKAVEVLPDDTPEVLQRRVMEQCEWQLLPQAVSLFCQDRLNVEGRTVRILNAECRMQNAE